MKMHSEIASIFIILLLIMGCYSYNLIKKEDIEKIEEYDEVKITTLVDKVYYLHNVEIQGSVLKGYKYIIQPYREKRVEEVVIPTDQIKKIEVDKFNPAITALTVVLIIGIPIAALAIALANADYH
jgi:hypothetical protein